jgi:hypothetical protein
MNTDKKNGPNKKLPVADTGNASNPSPHNRKTEPVNNDQFPGEGAEKYLRESANIEDEADAQDQQDADAIIEEEKS